MTELEMICKKADVKPSTCDCPDCQSMCRNAPCIGTPADIVNLINAGHVHQLELTMFNALVHIGLEPFPSFQIRHELGGCPLFIDGKCSVHHIKPTDGKLASCKIEDQFYDKSKPTYYHLIAEAWNKPENENRMKFIIKSVYKYQSLKPQNNGNNPVFNM